MPDIKKVQAKEEDVLHHIMQFYIYEFSKYIPTISLEDSGLFQPFDLQRYWKNDNFHAFFINLDGELIGFVLMESATESSPNTVQEFFIMAQHDGNGYGKDIAKKLFVMFPGHWKITQIENNKPAYAFWHGLIKEITKGDFTECLKDGKYIQEFRC